MIPMDFIFHYAQGRFRFEQVSYVRAGVVIITNGLMTGKEGRQHGMVD